MLSDDMVATPEGKALFQTCAMYRAVWDTVRRREEDNVDPVPVFLAGLIAAGRLVEEQRELLAKIYVQLPYPSILVSADAHACVAAAVAAESVKT